MISKRGGGEFSAWKGAGSGRVGGVPGAGFKVAPGKRIVGDCQTSGKKNKGDFDKNQ